jgi:hypothetical protein
MSEETSTQLPTIHKGAMAYRIELASNAWNQYFAAAICGLCSQTMGTGIWSGDTATRAEYLQRCAEVADAAEKVRADREERRRDTAGD